MQEPKQTMLTREQKTQERQRGYALAKQFLDEQVTISTSTHYLSDLTEEEYDLPDFQRGYVWTEPQAIAFMDRFRRGMPIGAILVWHRTHGARPLLLDGQQRMVSLGAKVYRNGERVMGHSVHIDAESKAFTCTPSPKSMTLADIVSGDFQYQLDHGNPEPFTIEQFAFLCGCTARLRQMSVVLIHLGKYWTPGSVSEQTALDFFRCYNSGGTPILEEDLPPLKEKP